MPEFLQLEQETYCINCSATLKEGHNTFVDFISHKEVCAACNTPVRWN